MELIIGDKELAGVCKEMGVGKSVLKKLMEQEESARKSKELATIVQKCEIKLDLAECKVTTYDKSKALAMLDEFGFKSLMNRLPQDDFEVDVQDSLF
jgi:5'-3' exonuclease